MCSKRYKWRIQSLSNAIQHTGKYCFDKNVKSCLRNHQMHNWVGMQVFDISPPGENQETYQKSRNTLLPWDDPTTINFRNPSQTKALLRISPERKYQILKLYNLQHLGKENSFLLFMFFHTCSPHNDTQPTLVFEFALKVCMTTLRFRTSSYKRQNQIKIINESQQVYFLSVDVKTHKNTWR